MTDFGKRFGHLYVNRGDPSAADFAVGDLTTDGALHDLDFSSIVPAGTKLIHFRVEIKDDDAFSSINFRNTGQSYGLNAQMCKEYIANYSFYYDVLIACDAARVIQYLASNTTLTTIDISVRGWFI